MIAPETILALWFTALLALAVLAGGLAWSVAVETRGPGAHRRPSRRRRYVARHVDPAGWWG